MISILDYGAGNLKSVQNALRKIGCQFKIIHTPEEIQQSSTLIFPGVGHFGQVMESLDRHHLRTAIVKYIHQGKPYLGICIGMQVLFTSSKESPVKKGLGIYQAQIQKFTEGKVPQIGWNLVVSQDKLLQQGYYYFVNSYYTPYNSAEWPISLGISKYHIDFLSYIQDQHITACQFHPEKSGDLGLSFLERWVRHVN